MHFPSFTAALLTLYLHLRKHHMLRYLLLPYLNKIYQLASGLYKYLFILVIYRRYKQYTCSDVIYSLTLIDRGRRPVNPIDICFTNIYYVFIKEKLNNCLGIIQHSLMKTVLKS